jgi:hypothetical protein
MKKTKKSQYINNPDDPVESYIRPGLQWSDYMKFAVGHILFIFALFGFAGNIYYRTFLKKFEK